MSSPVYFSAFDVSKQTFFRTATTAGVVNLMPIVPGRRYAKNDLWRHSDIGLLHK
jgi:hypothetical protein